MTPSSISPIDASPSRTGPTAFRGTGMYQAARETIVAPTSARPTPAPQSALSSETPRLPGLAPWCRSGTLAKQNARLERRPSRWDCRDRTVLERLTCRQETPAPGCLAGMARLSAYQPRMAFTGTSDNDLGGCGSLTSTRTHPDRRFGRAANSDPSFVDHHPDPAEVQRSGEWGAGIALT